MSADPTPASRSGHSRVHAVTRVAGSSLPSVLRGTEGLAGALPRPRPGPIPAEDVRLFERLVYGDAPRPAPPTRQAPLHLQAHGTDAAAGDVRAGDRIASTLRLLGRIPGL